MYQASLSDSAAAFHANGLQKPFCDEECGVRGKDDTRGYSAFLSLAVEHGFLCHEKDEAIVSFADAFDIVNTGDEYVRNNKRFYKRIVVRGRNVTHGFGLPDHSECPFRGEDYQQQNKIRTNQITFDRHGVIAVLTGSISAPCQNPAQVRDQLSSRISGKYYAAYNPALFLYVNHTDDSYIAVNRLDNSAGREGVRLNNGLRDWARLVSFSHSQVLS
jgi:hypothetical protein